MAVTSGLPTGVTQVTTGAAACGGVATCTSPFNLASGGQCCLKLLMTGNNMTLGSNNVAPLVQTTPTPTYSGRGDTLNVTVTNAPTEVTLTSSLSTLALSVNCQPSSSCTGTQNAALTGNPRQITITNTSTTSIAYNVTYTTSGLPAGTTITPASCGDIAANNGTCVLTITPGQTPSATPYLLNPTPITLTIAGDNTNQLSPTANVLTYGSVYESGYVYSIDDTYAHYPEGVSIGGKAITITDQAEPRIEPGPQATSIIWGSNGSGSVSADVSYDIIPGIDENSTSNSGSPAYSDGFTTTYTFVNMYTLGATHYTYSSANPFQSSAFNQCNGATDGSCNQGNIYTYYSQLQTNYGSSGSAPFAQNTTLPTPPTDYAAGLCTATISGHSDWYLPAICEMDSTHYEILCPASTQSMAGNLSNLIGDESAPTPSTSCLNGVNCLAGWYWSSTEAGYNPQDMAVPVGFGRGQLTPTGYKNSQLGVRCSRALTP